MADDEKKEESASESAKEDPKPVGSADSPSAAPKEKKIPTKDWPYHDIKEPHDHDVLYGRGGGTNHHIGNKRYRKMVEDRKVDYVNSKRLDKPLVALDIIRKWRAQDPPGRFLKLDEKTGLWHDVGDKKAREKTSQALREKAPELRKQQETDKMRKEGKLGSDEELEDESDGKEKETKPRVKKTAFNVPEGEPKKRDPKDLKHLMLARDHSLGRDYLKPDERVDLNGFSWDEPVGEIYGKKEENFGRSRQERASYPPTRAADGWGSGSFAHIAPTSSMPPPPPGPYASRSGGGSGDFQAVMPETHMSREHSLAMNPLPGAAVDGPARNPFPREGKAVSGGGLDEAWSRGPTHPPSQPYGFPPPSRQTSQSRFLSNEGSSAFSRTPSSQGGNRSRRSSATAEDSQHRSRSSSGRSVEHEYSQGPYYGGGGSVRREWSSQSDDYRKVAGMVGDDLYDIRRSWSGQSDDHNRPPYPPTDSGTPYPPPDGRSYSGHDSWPSHARPYSAAIHEGYAPSAPPPAQPHGAPRHAPQPHNPPPHSAASHGPYRHPTRRESSDRMSVDESRSSATAPRTDSTADPREQVVRGKDVTKPSLRRKLSGGGVTPHSSQPVESKRGLSRPQPVKRDTSHQCENDETKSRVKRSFISRDRDNNLAGNALANSDVSKNKSGATFEEEDRMKDLETTFQKSHLNSSATSSGSSTKPRAVSAKSRLTTTDAISMTFTEDEPGHNETVKAAEKNTKPNAVSAESRLTTVDAIGMAFGDDSPEDTSTMKSKNGTPSVAAKPKTITPKSRLSTEDAIGMVFAKPQSLSQDERLTSLGDPLDGDLLIDPMEADKALDGGDDSMAVKPGRLSSKQRVTTVDALLMEIEEEVDALKRPDLLTTGQRNGTTADGLSEEAIAKAWLDG